MQSDICSHIGAGGSKKCCHCDIGGNAEYVEGPVGYDLLFLVPIFLLQL